MVDNNLKDTSAVMIPMVKTNSLKCIPNNTPTDKILYKGGEPC